MTIVRLCLERIAIFFVSKDRFQRAHEDQPSVSAMHPGRRDVNCPSTGKAAREKARREKKSVSTGLERKQLVAVVPSSGAAFKCIPWRNAIRFILSKYCFSVCSSRKLVSPWCGQNGTDI